MLHVQLQAMQSEKLLTGPQLVVQGSTISCALFLIYVLDLPQIFHNTPKCPPTPHSPQEQINGGEPNTKYFVDDEYILITKKKEDTPLRDQIEQAMKFFSEYTAALTQDKSLIMLVTKKKN